MYAHLIATTQHGDYKYIVVLTQKPKLQPFEDGYAKFNGFLVRNLAGAFEVADNHNAELMEDGKQLLEGNFNGKA